MEMFNIDIIRKLLTFYQLNNPFDPEDNDFWRLRMINIFLILITFVYAFFIVFNLYVTHLYANAAVDAIGLLAVHAIIINYRRKQRIQETSHYIVISVFVLSAALIFVAEKNYGILFWSIFLPIFAMMLTGRKLGLYYSITYYAMLVAHLFANLGNGITVHIIVEFVVVSSILVAIIYYYELSRIQAYERLKEQALHDPLTSLYNRRYFDTVFPTEFNRLKREAKPFSFFMMDVDHFKKYNDHYGHHEGDRALKSVSNILNAYLRRPGDACFRLGGEEFGGITSCKDDDNGILYIEQIRSAIQDLEIEHKENGDNGVLTASFGYIVINNYKGLTPELIYKMADEALYRAKASGRNCVSTLTV
jgi:diguanylate cyclase (GGDEF)-like protein